ncbi:MAG: hypothetical protein V3W31_06895 [Thermodesulfobacteriota bacterium]
MLHQLWTNIKINLKFYRRNRLLLGTAVFISFVMGLSALPSLFTLSAAKHMKIIQGVFSQLSWFTFIITAGLAIMLISYHTRDRSVKMVFTKPCPPEAWILSSFLSASLVSLLLYAGTLAICSALFVAWDVPFQWGILYMTVNDFMSTIILISYMTFLAVLMHPLLALLFAVIFQGGTFFYIKLLLMGKAANDGGLSVPLTLLKGLVDGIYLLLPSFSPFSGKTSKLYRSLRLDDANWEYLLLTFGYTVFVSALMYVLSVYFFKKKRLI